MAKEPGKELIFFSKYSIGGVQNYYHSIISHDPYHEFHKKWIFTRYKYDTNAPLPRPYGICEEIVFDHSDDESIYEIAKRLNKHLTNKEGVVMTNYSTELATLHIHGKGKKTVFFVCHDKDYLETARDFHFIIDVFIAHNPFFYDELKKIFPGREGDIYYLPYGIDIAGIKRPANYTKVLRIAFIGRLQKSKGIFDLPEIDRLLKLKNIMAEWIVIGDGPEKQSLTEQFKSSKTEYYSPATTEEVLKLAATADIFILPSRLDGLPVAMLEAMSVGLVPLLSEFNPGIRKIISPPEGFIIDTGDTEGFARQIELLDKDRSLLETMSENCRQMIKKNYSATENSRAYYDLFRKYRELRKPDTKVKPRYGHLIHRIGVPKEVRKFLKILLGKTSS